MTTVRQAGMSAGRDLPWTRVRHGATRRREGVDKRGGYPRVSLVILALLLAGCAGTPAPIGTARAIPAPGTFSAWWPAGFERWPEDPTVAYRKVDAADCIADRCYAIEVVTRDGCPTSLYAEIALLSASDTQVGYSNDTTSQLPAGEVARLTFDIFEDDATKVRLTELSCY